MSATTTQLLSSGEFCKLRYDTIAVKSASANVSFCTNNSSSSSYNFHGVGPLVDQFRSHVSRSLFRGIPWFLLPVGE